MVNLHKVVQENVILARKVVQKSVRFYKKSCKKVYLLRQPMERYHYYFCRSADTDWHL